MSGAVLDPQIRAVRKRGWGVKGALYLHIDDVIDTVETFVADDLVVWLKEIRRDN